MDKCVFCGEDHYSDSGKCHAFSSVMGQIIEDHNDKKQKFGQPFDFDHLDWIRKVNQWHKLNEQAMDWMPSKERS